LNTPDILYLLGVASCRKRDFTLANEYFQQAANDAPSNASVLFAFAFCLSDLDYRPAANEKLRAALNMDPDFLPYYGSLDQAPRNYKDIQAAIDVLGEKTPAFEPDVQLKLNERIVRLRSLLAH
jgi:tetratricopeptide (TPR) repeat protein